MKASGQFSLLRFCLLMLMLVSYTDTYVFSKPRGGQVVSGTASFTQDGNLTVINASNRSIINYQSFDIGKGETVQFVQPNAHATVLNRVLTPDPTNIFGSLQSNGIVIISNPYGVFFQNGSVVNVGGLVAGAGKISDADFSAGKVHFTDLTGDVRNDGVIAADNRIALMGANVVNTGSMTAAHGMALMVSGPDVYVGEKNGNIFVQANGKALRAAAAAPGATAASAGSIANSGTVAAPRVVLGAGDMYSTAIVNSGLLQGRSIALNAGRNGSATVGGTLDANSAHTATATGKGGKIDVLGGTVALRGATLDASGGAGGGNVRVGGDFHGAGPLAHATTTTVDAASTIKADATGATGDGGTVVLWSDAATLFSGRISTQPGTVGGAGGQVEVSSHDALGFHGVVNAGTTGSLLLDPSNIEITRGGTTPGTPPTTTTATIPDGTTLTISQADLQATTGSVTLTASNDIKIDDLTDPATPTVNGGLTFGADATFTAGANTTAVGMVLSAPSVGSFVMANPANFITSPGHNISISASGVSVGAAPPVGTIGAGINGGTYAIQTGPLDTSSTTGAGGNVNLQITSPNAVTTANPAPVSVGAVNTASTMGAAGNVTINGSAANGNNAPNGVTVASITSTASGTAAGTTGIGGTVLINATGANGGTNAVLVGSIDTRSLGAAGGPLTVQITSPTAVTATNPAPVTLGDVNTTGGAGAGGNIAVNGSAANNLPNAITIASANASSSTAAGGAISFIGSGGVTATGGLAATSAASTTAAVGSVTINTPGAVSVGNVTGTVSSINTSSSSGPGGAITINNGAGATLPTSITVGVTGENGVSDPSLISTSTGGTGAGGAITLRSGGAVSVFGLTDSHSVGGAGGNISLTSTGDNIGTGQIYAGSTAATAANGGTVTVNTTGTLVIGQVSTASTAGAGGAITLGQAAAPQPSLISSGPLLSNGAGAGGSITLNTSGAITVTGLTNASSSGAAGGAISLTSTGAGVQTGNITDTSAVATTAAGGTGTVTIQGTGAVQTGTIDASSASGPGGAITIGAPTGGTAPTSITVGPTGAAATASALNTTAPGTTAGNTGAGGAITLNSAGAITVNGAVNANSAGAAGGAITLTSTGAGVAAGNVSSTSAVSTTAAGGTGTVVVNGTGAVTINTINTSSVSGPAGAITIAAPTGGTAPSSVTIGPSGANPTTDGALVANATGSTPATAGAGGAINVSSTGLITVNGLTSSGSARAAGGAINLTSSGGGVTTGELAAISAVSTTAAGGTGTVVVRGTGAVTVNLIDTSSSSGPGGAITIGAPTGGTAPTSITVGPASNAATVAALTSNASGTTAGNTGAGGAITLGSAGPITINGVTNASSSGAAAGPIAFTASGGGVTATGAISDLSAVSTTAAGGTGSVAINSDRAVQLSTVTTTSASGPGGPITVAGVGATLPTSITVGVLTNAQTFPLLTSTATGTAAGTTGAGGAINLSSSGAISLYGLTNAGSAGAAGGNLSITSTGDNIGTGDLSTAGATGGGTILASTTGTLFVGNVSSAATTGAGGTITFGQTGALPSSVTATTLNSRGTTTGGNIAIRAAGNTAITGLVQTNAASGGSFTVLTSPGNTATDTFTGIDTHGTTGAGGAVSIGTDNSATNFAPAHLVLNGAITANTTSGAGGAVNLKSNNEISGGAAINASTSTAVGGAGGTINATAGSALTLGVLNAFGYSTGGAIGLAAGTGVLTLTSANTSSVDGAAGNITLGGSGIISGALTATGGQGNGGTIAATSNGGISISGAISTAALGIGGTGGNVSLLTGTTPGAVSVLGITTNGATNGNAGNITVGPAAGGTAPTGITFGGNLSAIGGSSAGNGGTVSLTTSGNLDGGMNSILTSSATGTGGGITTNSGGVTVNALTSTGANGGGAVSLTSSGGITVQGAINSASTGTGGTLVSGNVSLLTTGTTPGAVSVQGITTTSSGTGRAGSITIGPVSGATSPTSITLNGALNANATNAGGGAGGAVSLTSSGNIGGATAQGINASSASASGGPIAAAAGGTLTLGTLNASGVAAGNGGDVTLSSGGTGNALNVGAITASATTSGHGGAVALTSTGTLGAGAINTSTTGSGAGGNVTATANGALTISGTINTSTTGAGAGGTVQLLTDATNAATLTPVTTQAINTSSGSGTGGSIIISKDPLTANDLLPTSITVNGPLTTTGGTPATAGPIRLESTGVVTLVSTAMGTRETFNSDTTIAGSSLVLQNGGGTVQPSSFDLTNHNLSITITGGITVDGSVGGTTGKFDNVNNFVVGAGAGLTTFDGNLATEGSQTYSGNGETLTADTILHAGTTNPAGIITFNAAGTFGFNDNADFAHNLVLVTGTGSTGVTISQPFGTTHPFLSLTATARQTTGQTTDALEPTTINAQTVAAGTQSYYTLALGGTGATTLTSTLTNGAISATGTVTGNNHAFNVNVNATGAGTGGTSSFVTISDAGSPVDFEVAGVATFGGSITASSFTLGGTKVGTNGLFGTATSGPVTVATTAGQTYGEPVYLGATLTLTDTAGGAINLKNLVRSATATAYALAVNTSGQTTFGGTVGAGGFPLLSLTTDLETPLDLGTALNGGSVTTSSAAGQVYNDAVTLGVAGTNPSTTLTANNGGAVYFGQTLQSSTTAPATPQALTISTTGVTTFKGAVGGPLSTSPTAATDPVTTAPALASLTTGAGEVDINGGSVTTVTSPVAGGATGAQIYGGSVVLGSPNTTFKGYSLSFSTTANPSVTSNALVANNPFNLTLDLFGLLTLPGVALGNIRDLTSNGPGEVQLNGLVSTQGSQTYINGPITLTGNTTLQAGTTVATAGITLGSTTNVKGLNNATVGGPFTLTLISGTGPGTGVTINEPIGATTPIASLTATGRQTNGSTLSTDEPVTINTTYATTIKTVGSQTYGSLILTGTGIPTLASTGTGLGVGIVSNGTVTGNGVGLTATVASPTGNSSFGAISNGGALSFTLNGTANFAGIGASSLGYLGTTGNFNGAVNVTGDVNVAGSTAVLFGSTLNAANVTSNGTGTTRFNGPVTAATLTVTNGTGVTLAAGTITTTGEQNYNEPVILASATQLTGQGTGLGTTGGNGVALNFSQAITGNFALSLTNTPNATAGGVSNTVFGGLVGTTVSPLLSLNTSPAGTTFINGGGVTTNGAAGQVYNGATLIGNTTTLAAGGGPVNFKGVAATLGSAVTPQALTITTTGTTTFDAPVGGPAGTALAAVTAAPALASLTFTNNGGPVDINGGTVTTVTAPVAGGATGVQNYGNNPVVLGANTLLKGYSISFAGGVTSGMQAGAPFSLTLDFFGLTSLPGAGNVAGVGDLITEGPGELQLNGLVATLGNQIYGNARLTLTGDTTLQAGTSIGTAGITLNSPLNDQTSGTHNLTLITGTTSTGVAINQPIGGTTPILSLTAKNQQTTGGTPATTATEPVTVVGLGTTPTVTTLGSQTYGTLILGGAAGVATTLTSTAPANTVATGTVGINAGAVTGNAHPLTINVASTNASSALGPITGAGALTLNMQGLTNITSISDPLAAVSYTGGTVNFGAVTATDVGINATGAATFNSTLNAANVTSNGPGTTRFNGPVTATTLTVTGGTGVTLAAGTITTTGEQNYNEPATLASANTLTGQGTAANGGIAVRFGAMLTGDFALMLANTPSGVANVGSDTIFAGPVGTLLSLSTSAVGTTFINGGTITTNGTAGQVYNGPVVLGATGATPTTTLAAGAGPVNFINATATVVSAPGTLQALVINTSGLTTFDAQVGGAPDATTTAVTASPALASLTTLGGGTVDINGGGVTTVTAVTGTATGAQNYGGPVVLTGDATLKGNTLTLATGAAGGLAGGGFNLTLNFASQITLPSGIAGVNNFSSVGLGGVFLNGTLTTTGNQTYRNGTLTLSGAAGLTSTAGNLDFYTLINGTGSLALSALGTAAGTGLATFHENALVGSSITPIGAFTSNTARGTIFNINAGASTAGDGGVNAASVAITGPVTFNEAGSTLANNTHPSILTTGAQTYNGPVTLTLDTSLVSNGAGAITFNPLATIDSATPGGLRALNLNTTGNQTFGGLIGSVNALSSLTTGTGTTFFTMTIPTGPSTVAAGVLVNGPVTTGGPASFAVTNSSLAQPSVLTLGSGAQTYGAATVPPAAPGTAITLAGPVTVLNSADSVAGGVFTGGGSITINGNIVAGVANPELDVRAGVGTTVFGGSVYTSSDFSPGGANVVFNGSVGTLAAPVGVFTVLPNNGGPGTGLVDLNGGTYVTGGSFLFTLPTLLSADTTLQAANNITFNNTLNGINPLVPYSLTINLNGGTVAFNGVVGGTTPLASLTIGNLGATLGTARFAMDLSGLGANQGGVNVLGAVKINTNADFETSSTGSVPTIYSGLGFPGLPAGGGQTYGQVGSGAAIILGQNTLLRDNSLTGGLTFNGRINATTRGGAGLSVYSVGTQNFNQLVGDKFALASLQVDASPLGSTFFNMDLTQSGAVAGVQVTGAVTAIDRVTFNAAGGALLPTILSGGGQSYANSVTVQQDTVLTGGSGNIVFSSTVDSASVMAPRALTVNTPGNEVFNSAVGAAVPLASLTTDATGTRTGQAQFLADLRLFSLATGVGGVNTTGAVTINDGVLFQVAGATGLPTNHPSVASGGTQTYNGAATLGAPTTLVSTGGNIVFNSTVDSVSLAAPQALTLTTSAVGSAITFAQPVGDSFPLASLTTQGSGTTQLNGRRLTTTGDQTFNNAVTLGQDAVLRSGTNITFNNTLDGNRNLEVDANTANFELVGGTSPLLNLTVNAPTLTSFFYAATPGNASVNLAGVLTVNGPVNFRAAGAGNVAFVRTGVALPGVNIPSGQNYNGTFALQGTASFNDLKSGDITFAQAVDGFGANSNVTVGTGGTISFLAPVGAATPLASLTLNNLGLATGEAVLGGGSITTTGTQVFNDAVFLSVGTTLTSTAGGMIAFALTLDSDMAAAPQALVVNTSGQTIFNGAVGATNPLASLTTDNEGAADAGTFVNGGSITTTGTQLFNDAVFLGATTTLASTAGGDLHFALTLDSDAAATPRALTLNTAGGTIFDGRVGSAFALASLTTDDEGAADLGTFLNGGRVTTVGAQTYNDAVTLGAATILASTANGALTFNSRLNGAFDLTLNTGGQTIFNGRIGNLTPLASLTTDNAGAAGEATQFNLTVSTNSVAGVVVNGPITINDGVFLNVKGASLAQPGILTIGNATQTYNGPVTLGTNTYLTSAAGLPAAGAGFTGGGAILFTSPQGIASAGGGDLFIRAGVGTTTFASTVSAQNLDLGGALVTVAGPIALVGTLSVEPNGNAGGGSITFNGGNLTTIGGQTYNVPLVLGADTFLTSTGGGNIQFVTTLDGAHNLTIDTTGDEIFGGRVGGITPLLSLTTDDPRFSTPGGHVIFNFAGGTTASPSVTTVGAQVYNDAAILGADTVLASTGGGITFNQLVDSDAAATPRTLTLNAAGDETFNARVGSAFALASLTTDDAAGRVSGGRVVFNIPGSTTALPGVTTTAFQTYNDAVILQLDTVLASTGGGALTFASTVDSATAAAPRALTLNTAGNERFNGQVGGTSALLSVTTDDPAANTGGGQTIFAYAGTGRSVITTGFQTYNDAVTLQAATTLASSTLTFASTVDGAYALTLNTVGTTTFQDAVGGGAALASLTTKAGPVVFNGRTVTTTGLQTYGGVATLGVDTVLTSTAAGGGITFATTVDSATAAAPRALTLNAVGDETFNGRVGGGAALASLTTDNPAAGVSGGRVVFNIAGSSAAAPGVTTTGAQTYNDAAVLQLDTVLASTGGGTLTFASTLDGAHNLTLDSRGDEVFGGTVGGRDALTTLTTDDSAGNLVGGRVIFGATGATAPLAVTTTGAQTYNDAVLLQAGTTLTSTAGGALMFNSTIDGGQTLTLNSRGDETFLGQIGGQIALTSLAIDADPANAGGMVNFYFNGSAGSPSVRTTGFQTYGDAVTLRADTALLSTGGRGLTFNSTVDGSNVANPRALTLLTNGNTTFNAVVGSLKPLGDLTIGSAPYNGGQTVFNMNVGARPRGASNLAGVNVTGAVTISNAVVFNTQGSGPASPTVQATDSQTYNGAITLTTDTVLASTGPAATLTLNSTVDGAANLTLSTPGETIINGALGGAPNGALASLSTTGGPVTLNGGTITTTGAQAYSGAVTLTQDTVLTSRGDGITFGSTLDGEQNLTLDAAQGTSFAGAVGSGNALLSLTATDGSGVILNGGGVTTHGLQTYGGTLDINGADGGTTTLRALNDRANQDGSLVFKQNVTVNSGSLLVQGRRILAQANSNINVAGAGDLNLETSDVLILRGTSYGSVSGKLTLNDLGPGATPPDPVQRATILLTNARTLLHGGNFDMGYLQNLYSLGALTISVPGGNAALSDIAAANSLTVTAATITLHARAADPARGGTGGGGGTDDGLNFVANNSINFGQSPISYDDSHVTNNVANFVTTNGLVTVNRDQANGVSLFQDPTLPAFFQQNNPSNFNDANFDSFILPFQPISGGTQTIDTAAALSGALPDQKPLDVASDITISASQLEELLKLGIHPRKAQRQERLSLSSKRALFAQLVDGLDKDNYGRLQPIKGGISRLVPSDYVVVVDRMSEPEVQAILTAFEQLYGKNKEKAPPIGEAFNTAFTDYTAEKQTADPAGFAPFISSKPGKYPDIDKAVRGFDNLFGYIESLGLTEKEIAKAKEHIASDLQVAGVSPEDMAKVIDTLRTKIPKKEKAPSTKLPPSPPATNPAPGATNPPTPEQKKATPPLKTALETLPTRDDRLHDVAGL